MEKGVAAISQNDWFEPILCKVDKYEDYYGADLPGSHRKTPPKQVDVAMVSHSLLDIIMSREIYRQGDRVDLRMLKNDVIKSGLDTSIKCEFIEYLDAEKGEAVPALRRQENVMIF